MAHKYFSTHEVAVRLDINESRVRKLANDYGYGARVGRAFVFTEDDIEKLQQRPDRRRKQARPASEDASR